MKKQRSTLTLLAAALAGYAAGTFPTANVVASYAARRHTGSAVDLRRSGTGNPGALNAAKLLGWKWSAIVLAGDMLKGALAALAGRALGGDNGAYAAGSAAVVGHCAPVWSGFRGGKGVATSAGTCLVCFPAYMPIDMSLAAAALTWSRGRAEVATYVASGVFIAAAVYWWRSGRTNLWGPKPTAWLPLYALSSSAMIAYRFLRAERTDSARPTPQEEAPQSAVVA